jgi:hypothetical protein
VNEKSLGNEPTKAWIADNFLLVRALTVIRNEESKMHTVGTKGLVVFAAGVGLFSLSLPVHAQTTVTKGQTKPNAQSAKPQTAKVAPVDGNSGRTVTLDVRNAPLRDTLQQLFLQTNTDYILDPNITGTITMKVTNVPFEEALRLLVQYGSTPISLQRISGVYEVKAAASRSVVAPVYSVDVPPAETAPTVTPPMVRTDGRLAGTPIDGFAPGSGFGFATGAGYGLPVGTFGFPTNGLAGGPMAGTPFGGPTFGTPFGNPIATIMPGFGNGFGGGFGSGFGLGFPVIVQTAGPGFLPFGGFGGFRGFGGGFLIYP